MTGIKVTEGEIDFHAEGSGKPCKTWYKIYGDLGSGVRPLIALHGGPGVAHNYLLSLQDLASKYGTPVIFYDQLGCGKSTHLPEKKGDYSFWTISLFLRELSNLISSLCITSYSLFGNSWGGMLAAEHACLRPPGLHRVIIADSPADMVDWVRAANDLRERLPENVRETLERCEREGRTESKDYEEAVWVFYKRHVCRVNPWPSEVEESFAEIKRDGTVYLTMNGPSEFYVVGSLKDWNIKDRVSKIEVPAMLLNGAHDEATDMTVQPYFELIPRVRWFTFANSSHMPHWEEREQFMQVVARFIQS